MELLLHTQRKILILIHVRGVPNYPGTLPVMNYISTVYSEIYNT